MWEIEILSQHITMNFQNPYTQEEMEEFQTMSTNGLAAVQTINIFNKIIGGPVYCNKCNRPFNTKRARAAHQWRCKDKPIRAEFFSKDYVKKIPVPKLVFSTKFLEGILENKLKRLQKEWNYALNWYMVENPSWP